ncbi:MAG: 2,5-diamino-6-(ribosylamino)-4(3H)-pyrimidinone 5'-phosphate reductase [Candidatus Thermoplasmatota archaeon]|nr:2,5-diamino-6-(ribosylamino)-4(3H)-pyrimidinone 5'-phosphate reductase [Candidatus Thermoplasmatota archaeon]
MNRPKIIVNCAMSVDGKIASPTGKQVRISSNEDMRRVYQLRHSVDAVLVGINTVLNDDPKLTVKEKYVKDPCQPIRIVLDTYCRTPENALIVNDNAKTIIIKDEQQTCSKKYHENVTVLSVPSIQGMINLKKTVQDLSKQGVNTLLVEGGGTVIWNFITQGLVDDLFVYIGSMIIGGTQTPTMCMGQGFEHEDEFIRLQFIESKQIGDGLLLHYQLK